MARKKKKTRTRPIVTGYLEKVSLTIFKKYRKEITDMTTGQQGIYALYRKDKLHNVGKAGDLRTRIPQHLRDRHRDMWTHFSLYVIRHPDHIKELESLLLRIADPTGNSVKGRFERAVNLLPVLRKKTKKAAIEEWEGLFNSGGQPKKAWATRKRKSNGDKESPCKGLFEKTVWLYGSYNGVLHSARLFKTGRIKYNGKFYNSPSAAGSVARGGKATNGWWFWKVKNSNGELVRLREYRN